jgi:peptidyl-prolyl cis-trans isomerase C
VNRNKLSLFGAVLFLSLACSRGARDASAPAGKVVARVNGVAITQDEVRLETGGVGGHPGAAPVDEKTALEKVVDEELEAQHAAKQGLAPSPEANAQLARLEAQLATLRRRALASAYERAQASTTGDVSDAEARKYFEDNAQRIRTEVHVEQLLLRDQGQIEQAHRELEAGTPFEAVAQRAFPGLPADVAKPWDLGWLRWFQIPQPWREVLPKLANGQSSGVIAGPRSRYWIVHVVERRENPQITFESAKPEIVETLRAERAQALHAQKQQELRSGAKISYEQQTPSK